MKLDDHQHNERVSLLLFKNLNRPFLILGLTPLAFVLFIIPLLLVSLVNTILAGGLFVFFLMISAIIQKENRRGYPDYLRGQIIHLILKKHYSDRGQHLPYLLRNETNRAKKD